MNNDQLLNRISDYCRQAGMAETTFGRRAVNDGKLVYRLREGKRITLDTLERIEAFVAAGLGVAPPPRGLRAPRSSPSATKPAASASTRSAKSRQVQRVPWLGETSASRSGHSATARSSAWPMVIPSSGASETPQT
jgi:DNA-binding transcriptional LysR family regulator